MVYLTGATLSGLHMSCTSKEEKAHIEHLYCPWAQWCVVDAITD
jgi:hypothetical protein